MKNSKWVKFVTSLFRKKTWKVCRYCDEKISTDPEYFDSPVHKNGSCIERIQYERQMYCSGEQQAKSDLVKISRKFRDLRRGLIVIYGGIKPAVDLDCVAQEIAYLLNKIDGYQDLGMDEDYYNFKWRDDLDDLKRDGEFYDD